MSTCLLPEKIEEFKKALVSRKLNMADLLNMEPVERIKILEEYAGDNAKDVNNLFEEKIILKNRELGIKNALRKLTETGKYSKSEIERLNKIKTDWRAAQRERIFSPEENEAFLGSLAEKFAGTEITREESTNLFALEKATSESLESGYDRNKEKWISQDKQKEYEVAKLVYEKYYQSLLHPEQELSGVIKDYIQEYKDIHSEFEGTGKLGQALGTTIKGTSKALADTISTIFNASRLVLATADNSFFGTQGNQMMLDHPKEWFKQLGESFVRIKDELSGIDTFDAIMMKMYSDPNYINGRMQKAGVVDTQDELFPTLSDKNIKLGETASNVVKAPVVKQVVTVGKRVNAAAESAFKGSSLLLRMNAFNEAVELAKSEGIDVDDKKELEEIGNIINTATGRGKLDATNPIDAVAKVLLWSARLLKAKINIFTNYFTAKTPFAKKMAFKSLIRFMLFAAATTALSEIFNSKDTKTNPLDSRFGKIPIGKKRYLDINGGRLAIVGLMAKLAPAFLGGGGKISAKDDKFVPFSNKPGGSTRLTEILNFVGNRLSPGLGLTVDVLKGQNRNFEEITPKNVLLKNFVPMSGQTVTDIIVDGPSAEKFIDTALNFLGFNVSDYSDKKTTKKKK